MIKYLVKMIRPPLIIKLNPMYWEKNIDKIEKMAKDIDKNYVIIK